MSVCVSLDIVDFARPQRLLNSPVAQHAVAVAKAGEHLESACQGRHEVAVLGRRLGAFGRRNFARLIHLRGLFIDTPDIDTHNFALIQI